MNPQPAHVLKLPPFFFVHILDTNAGVTRVEVGPKRITCLDNDKVVFPPREMFVTPPGHYCIIENPVKRNASGDVVLDKSGQVMLWFGQQEIRFSSEIPFPLYPGENRLSTPPLEIVPENQALRVRALRDFTDIYSNDIQRRAGDEWLHVGPSTYMPQVHAEIKERIVAALLVPGQALRLKALKSHTDLTGHARRAGEEWLVRSEGAYLPLCEQSIVSVQEPFVLTKTEALHLRALRTFTDFYGKQRKAGTEWIITVSDSDIHVVDVDEELVNQIQLQTLTSSQFCIITNPVDEAGVPQLGKSVVRRGPAHFFLQPDEVLGAIQAVYVLGPEQSLIVRAKEGFTDESGGGKRIRKPGDRWCVFGPTEFVPTINEEVVRSQRAMIAFDPLGLYVFPTRNFFLLLLLAFALLLSLYLRGQGSPKTEL